MKMSVITTYDEKRDKLREALKGCVKLAKELLDEDTWGYDGMRDGYAMDVFTAVKNARDLV